MGVKGVDNPQYMNNWYTMQPVRTDAVLTPPIVKTPPIVETTPTEYVCGGDNFFIPTYRLPSVEGGSTGYTGPELKGGVCAAKFLETA